MRPSRLILYILDIIYANFYCLHGNKPQYDGQDKYQQIFFVKHVKVFSINLVILFLNTFRRHSTCLSLSNYLFEGIVIFFSV